MARAAKPKPKKPKVEIVNSDTAPEISHRSWENR